MTSQNNRLNQAAATNAQLRTVALQWAINSREPGEHHDATVARANAYFDFLKVAPGTSLEVVSSMPAKDSA